MLRHLFSCRQSKQEELRRKKQREMIRLAGIIIFIVIMLKVFKQLKFFSLLDAVMKLETGNRSVVKVKYRDLLFVSKKNNEDEIEIFTEEMEKISWRFIGQYGRGYVFEQDGEELFVHKKKFLGIYNVYSIANKDYFYSKTSVLVQ